ncbi:MAG: lysophospholipid acyltransferase family protein, partial [Casimicrobiaceae bacterium]
PEDDGAAAQALNHAVEAIIRRCPEQYLWTYNRYKQPTPAAGT